MIPLALKLVVAWMLLVAIGTWIATLAGFFSP